MIRQMKNIVIPLYSVLVRLHLEHCVQFGVTLMKKNVEKQEKATRMVCSLNKNRLRELMFFNLAQRNLKHDIIILFNYLKGSYHDRDLI